MNTMKTSFKSRLFALLLALITASVIAAAADQSSISFGKKLGFNFGSTLIFGFPVYVTFILLHYWLCKKLNVHSSAISSLIGALLMLVTWLFIALAQPEPNEFERDFSPIIALIVGGAVYGFANGYFSRNTEPA